MEPLVFVLVLSAALLHAAWNGLIKVGGDPLSRLAVVNLTGSACALCFLPFVTMPSPQSWSYLGLSIAAHHAYYVFLVLAYRVGDLSLVYPVARGSSPLFVALFAAVFVGEPLNPWGTTAVAIISLAIFSLAWDGGGLLRGGGVPVIYALLTGLSIGFYTMSDALGGRASGDVLGYITALFLIDGLPFALVAVYLRRKSLGATLATCWKPAVGGGVLAFGAYGLVIWALSQSQMTYVAALRETSVIFAALIGSRFLSERFGTRRAMAAAAVAAGVVLLQTTGSR